MRTHFNSFSNRITGCEKIAAGLLLAAALTGLADAQSTQQPLSDFINAQGTTTCFTPPAPAQLGWGTGVDADGNIKTNGNADNLTPPRFALVDYTGLEGRFLLDHYGINLGTTVSGTVKERSLADGHALVTVDVHTNSC